MSPWCFDRIAAVAGGRWLVAPSPGGDVPLGVAIDTRELRPGNIFVAFRGERVDGHAFLAQAQAAGAGMALVTDASAVASGLSMPVLLVNDATRAMTELASFWRDALDGLRVVGVTGSNGKTTTCRLVHAAACSEGGLPGTAPSKSFNNELGVPVTVLNARPGDRVLVCEIGMSTPGEIARRCETARPDAAIITTVAEAHFAGLGSLDAIAAEKAAIAAGVPEDGLVVMPAGLDALDRAVERTGPRARVVRVGDGADADVRLSGVHASIERTAFNVDGVGFEVPLPGAHNASNAALAVVVARWLGVGDAAIRRGLADAKAPPMRLQRQVIATDPPITVINDAYNANPGSMRAALAVLASTPATRRVAVLGDMLELGEISERAHRAVLAAAGEAGLDAVITLGPGFAGAGGDGEATTDDAAVERLASRVRPGDTVLVKGSRGVRLERLIERLRARASHAGAGA